ncbi:hypothetical protein [Cetobacterium sp.]
MEEVSEIIEKIDKTKLSTKFCFYSIAITSITNLITLVILILILKK